MSPAPGIAVDTERSAFPREFPVRGARGWLPALLLALPLLLAACQGRLNWESPEDPGRDIRLMDGGAVAVDGGAVTDSGAGSVPDRGAAPDAGPNPGPDPVPDAGSDAGGEPDPEPDPGCGSAVEQQQLALTNAARGDAGLPALICDEALTRAARLHSQDMCDQAYFSHTSLDGRTFDQRIVAQGASFRTAGENIAHGQPTPESVHVAWMNSSGHRSNILGAGYGRIGIGHAACGGRPYWTQDFTD